MAIDSVLAEGVRVVPVSQIRSLFPFLKNPANRHKAVGFTPEQFHYAFTKAKGKAKEATGAVTGDKEKKAKGRSDQTKGTAKDKLGKTKDLLK